MSYATDVRGLLDGTLRSFSLDLVKIVWSYLVFPTATPGIVTKLLLKVGSPGHEEGQFNSSIDGVAWSSDYKIWVSSGCKVQMFGDDGTYLQQVAQGQLAMPRGIAFAANGHAYIADRLNQRIQVFQSDGLFVRQVNANSELGSPLNVAVDREKQRLFVTDGYGVNVLELDDGRIWLRIGQGKLQDIRGVAVHASGQVAVTDVGKNHMQVCRWCLVRVCPKPWVRYTTHTAS